VTVSRDTAAGRAYLDLRAKARAESRTSAVADIVDPMYHA